MPGQLAIRAERVCFTAGESDETAHARALFCARGSRAATRIAALTDRAGGVGFDGDALIVLDEGVITAYRVDGAEVLAHEVRPGRVIAIRDGAAYVLTNERSVWAVPLDGGPHRDVVHEDDAVPCAVLPGDTLWLAAARRRPADPCGHAPAIGELRQSPSNASHGATTRTAGGFSSCLGMAQRHGAIWIGTYTGMVRWSI